MTINGANFTVTADTLCNDGSVEKYFTGGAPSGWSVGALRAAGTIAGTGFGTKSTTSYYDDFEARETGATGGSIGDLVVSNSGGSSISTAVAHSGSKALSQDYSSESFPKIYKSLSGSSRHVYMSCWLRWSGSVAGSTVWKFGRVGAGAAYSGVPRAGESYVSSGVPRPGGFGGEMVSSNGITGYGANADTLAADGSLYAEDTWQFYELEFDAGTADGSDSYFIVRVNNTVALEWDGKEYLTAANSQLPDWVLLPINGLDNAPSIIMTIDELYIDESRARVIMTDNATYSISTKYSAQPVTAWSDTSISYTQKRGEIGIGETAYLHVFNNSGALVHTTPGFTVEAD